MDDFEIFQKKITSENLLDYARLPIFNCNYLFDIPISPDISTTAMNGDVLSYDAVLGELRLIDLPGNNNVANVFSVACGISQELETTYTRFASFIFEGSNVVGTPTTISVIASATTNENTYGIRIQDITNQTTIATISGLDFTDDTIIDMGTISNITTTQAIWEIQANIPVGTTINLFINSISILF